MYACIYVPTYDIKYNLRTLKEMIITKCPIVKLIQGYIKRNSYYINAILYHYFSFILLFSNFLCVALYPVA